VDISPQRHVLDICPAIVLYTADAGDGKAADILADNLEADPNSIELSATTIKTVL
jgi:hypothetical protein